MSSEKKSEMVWATHVVLPFVEIGGGNIDAIDEEAKEEARRYQKTLEEAAVFARWRRKHTK